MENENWNSIWIFLRRIQRNDSNPVLSLLPKVFEFLEKFSIKHGVKQVCRLIFLAFPFWHGVANVFSEDGAEGSIHKLWAMILIKLRGQFCYGKLLRFLPTRTHIPSLPIWCHSDNILWKIQCAHNIKCSCPPCSPILRLKNTVVYSHFDVLAISI